jgi:hypothetical protein
MRERACREYVHNVVSRSSAPQRLRSAAGTFYVHLAAYGSLPDAESDWVVAVDERALDVVDAALVELDDMTVRACHRWSPVRPAGPTRDWPQREPDRVAANGSAALAVIALLRPVALLAGAVAGGVGGQMLAALDASLSRAALGRLGDVFDAAPIVVTVIASHRTNDRLPWTRAAALAVEHADISADDLAFAVLADGMLL